MKRKLFFLFAVALCMAMALPTKAQTDDSGVAHEVKSKKTLPYPRATKAVPASAMEYDSIAGCFVVRDTIVPSRAAARSGAARTVLPVQQWLIPRTVYSMAISATSSRATIWPR